MRSNLANLLRSAAAVVLVGCGGPLIPEFDAGGDADLDTAVDTAPWLDTLPDTAPADVEPIDLDVEPGCNPFSPTDACLTPFPSSWHLVADASTGTGFRVRYPEQLLEGMVGPRLEPAPFEQTDGASPTAPLFVHLGVDVDPTQLIPNTESAIRAGNGLSTVETPILLLDLDAGLRRVPIVTENDERLRTPDQQGRHPLIIRPLVPLQWGHRHLVVLRRSLRSVDGAPLPESAAFSALRDRLPTRSTDIELVRPGWELIFDRLAQAGVDRQGISLAWDFVVASEESVLGPLFAMRRAALDDAARSAIPYSVDRVVDLPNASTSRIVEGSFSPPTFVDGSGEMALGSDGLPLEQPRQAYPYVLVIPQSVADAGQGDLLLVGHRLFGTGRAELLGDGAGPSWLEELADEAGVVLLAGDWVGLAAGDEALVTDEVPGDLNRLGAVTDRLQQSLLNALVMTELGLRELNADSRVQPSGRSFVTPNVSFAGWSLGGTLGVSLFGLSPRIGTAVALGSGGSWSNVLDRTVDLAPLVAAIERQAPDPLTRQTLVTLLQSRFDRVDPILLARLVTTPSDGGLTSPRTLLLQEAIGDCSMPNLATRMLARSLGARLMSPSIESVFGLEEQPAPLTGVALQQFATVEAGAYVPPVSNLAPERDNGAQAAASRAESARAALLQLLRTRTANQTCSGACDPD